MDVSIFGVFLAGIVSFLSPCVLPLVPGYVSMLSGVGVEQLKEGQGSTGKLLSSAFAFVCGFSAVFITFGASASAVGSFLLKNKNLLAPIAGALIILFGLHLVGWLVKITVRVGLIAGVVLIAAGLVLMLRTGTDFVLKPIHFYAAALIFLLGPSMTRWLNRDIHLRNVGGGSQPGIVSGFLLGFAFAFGWTPCIGPILGSVLAVAATKDTVVPGSVAAGLLFGGTRDSVSAHGGGHRPVPEVLSEVPEASASRRGFQRSSLVGDRRFDFREPANLAFAASNLLEPVCTINGEPFS